MSQVINTFSDVVWHASWSVTGDILAVSGGDNKVSLLHLTSHDCTELTPQVTLWKESHEGEWVCVSEVDRGQHPPQ